jgi:dienelactone hydrolase
MKVSNMKKLMLPLMVSVGLLGCVSDDESVPPVPPVNSTFKASFVPAGGVFPFPNDLWLSGTTDGTLNIAVADATDYGDYLVALNSLDGWSTTAPMFVPFSGALDAASITAASVLLVNVTNPLAPVPLTFGTHYTAGVSPATDGATQLMITPLAPLTPKARYAVIVTRGITSGGTAAVADTTMQQLLDIHTTGAPVPPELAPLYTTAGLGNVFTLANALGVPDSNIAVVFTVSTQSTTDTLAFVNGALTAGTIASIAAAGTNKSLLDPTSANPAIVNVATIYGGFMAVPYYGSRTNILTGRWQTALGTPVTRYTIAGGAGPVASETINVPILISIPNAGSPSGGVKPGAGWPVVVFSHGITGDRSNMIAIAQAYANAGYAVVAVDHSLHGLPVGHPLRAFNTAVPGVTIYEQTFDADVSNNTSGAAGADGTTDTSGQNYINLSQMLTFRANVMQSSVNQIQLIKSLGNLSYDGVAGGDFDLSRMHFTGMSLGAITGTVTLGVNTNVQAATLNVPGGPWTDIARNSATFAPRVNAGLIAAGVTPGTTLYEQFMQAAQTVADAADPINFAAAANANHAILLHQVIGTSAATSDQVVPNSATARLISALGLSKRSTVGAFANTEGYVNFVAGGHSSLLSPTASAAVTVEMQTETATWKGSNGAAFSIADGTVVQP